MTSTENSIGIVLQGGISPANWSGSPAGLARGIEECGYAPVVCGCDIPERIYRLFRGYLRITGQPTDGFLYAPAAMKAREIAARWRRRDLPAVRGWVVLGSENGLPIDEAFVTLDDMTVAQARQHTWYLPPIPTKAWEHWQANQRRLYRRSTRCFAASSWVRDSICRDYGIKPEKVELLGFGRNLEIRAPSRRDWSKPRFLFVGSDWKRKNGPEVVKAFAHVRGRFPSAELSLVGNHPPLDVPGVHGYGPLNPRAPEELEIIEQLFAESTCLVLPSLLEPFGIVYAEAAGAGLAIIGTTIGGAPDVVGPAGVCVDPRDGAALENAMEHMSDPIVAERYGSAGPAHAERYTWRNVATHVARAFREAESS